MCSRFFCRTRSLRFPSRRGSSSFMCIKGERQAMTRYRKEGRSNEVHKSRGSCISFFSHRCPSRKKEEIITAASRVLQLRTNLHNVHRYAVTVSFCERFSTESNVNMYDAGSLNRLSKISVKLLTMWDNSFNARCAGEFRNVIHLCGLLRNIATLYGIEIIRVNIILN